MLLKAILPDLSPMIDISNLGLVLSSFSSLSQVTLPNLSTIRNFPRWDFRQTVVPSPDGSTVHICFFFIVFPFAFILLPKVSCVMYILLKIRNFIFAPMCLLDFCYLELTNPIVQLVLSERQKVFICAILLLLVSANQARMLC